MNSIEPCTDNNQIFKDQRLRKPSLWQPENSYRRATIQMTGFLIRNREARRQLNDIFKIFKEKTVNPEFYFQWGKNPSGRIAK